MSSKRPSSGVGALASIAQRFVACIALALLVAATAAPARAENDYRIQFVNNASQPVYKIHATNASAHNWGRDHLGDAVLMPGNSITIDLDDGSGICNFDFKFVMRDGSEIIRRGVNVCQVSTYPIEDRGGSSGDHAQHNYSVQFLNHASQPVFRIFGTNERVSGWGNDHLGDRTIAPGGTFNINFDDGSGICIFDFKIVMRDGSETVRRGINVCQISTYTIDDQSGAHDGDARDYRVRIINHASQPIYRIFGTNEQVNGWGEDHLGTEVIMPGASYTVNFRDGSGICNFDFKVVMRDNSEIIRRGVNVCQISSYTVED
jgi:hypothetical protein